MEHEHEQYKQEQIQVYSFWNKNKEYKDIFNINKKILSELDIFMPIIIYKFEVEILENKQILNIFEETILKLAELEIIEASIIHDAILLEEDLIKFIQNKLIEKKFLNKDNRISINGIYYLIQNNLSKKIYEQEFIEKFEEIRESNKYKNDYKLYTGHAFVGINKKLMPLMEFRNINTMCSNGIYREDREELDKEKSSNKQNKSILNFSIKIGSAGTAKDISAILNKVENEEENDFYEKVQLNQFDIKENFEKFFSKFKDLDFEICKKNTKDMFSSYVGTENKTLDAYDLEKIEKIKIISKEKGYMHYKAIILDGDSEDIIVSNGFSKYDSNLSYYIKNNNKNIVQYLNKIGAKSKTSSSLNNKNFRKNINNINDKYSNIKKNLEPIVSAAQKYINYPDKKNQLLLENQKKASYYYKALGFTIYYYIKNTKFDYTNSSIINNFIKISSEQEKIENLKQLLINININVNEYNKKKHYKLFELDSKKILDVINILNKDNNDKSSNKNSSKNSSLNIKVLLLLAVVEANENYKDSYFYSFINDSDENKNEMFLNRLFQISKIRNNASHGNKNKTPKEDENYEKNLKKYYNYIYTLAIYLLRDFYIDKVDKNTTSNVSIENASQERINAMNRLSDKFGVLYNDIIFEENKEYFIMLCLYLNDDINTTEAIKTMANIFESIFRSHINNLLVYQKKGKIEVSKYEVIQKIKKFDIPIPIELDSVREEYFEHACYNRNASLGAYFLLFLNDVLTKNNNFIELNIDEIKEIKNIIISVCKIISFRGNGNISITINDKELLSLVDEVFDTTKTIINIIN